MPTPAHNKAGSFRNSRAAQIFRTKEEGYIINNKYDDLWKMLEKDYRDAMKQTKDRVDEAALKEEKNYYYQTTVPQLKKT